MANHFNDLLLQTLKQINVRLDWLDGRMDRLDTRMDRLLETKADKTDLEATNGKFDDLGYRLERIDAEFRTLTWVIGTEVAVIGVILAFI